MRSARSIPSVFCIITLSAALMPATAGAVAVFTAAVGSTVDQDPISAAANASFTNNLTTEAWSGSAVSNGVSGAGAQLVLSASNSSTYAFVCGQNACTYVTASANTSDMMRILPTTLVPAGTPVEVRFDVTLDGSVVGNGGWSYSAGGNVDLLGVGISDGTGGTVGAFNLAVHEVSSFTRTLLVGTEHSLSTSLNIGALMRGIGPQPYGIDVDFLDTLKIQGFVLTEGLGPLQLMGDSGRDYFLAPVPLPAAGWLLLSGLIGLGAAARRRSTAAAA